MAFIADGIKPIEAPLATDAPAMPTKAGASGGLGGALGGLAGATPWGAAIGAVGDVVGKAIASDAVPVTSGGGATNIGPMIIGAKVVGGGSAGGTTASQSASAMPAGSPAMPNQGAAAMFAQPPVATEWLPWVAVGVAALAVVFVVIKK